MLIVFHLSLQHVSLPFPTSFSTLAAGLCGPQGSPWPPGFCLASANGKPQPGTGRRWERDAELCIFLPLPFQAVSGHLCPVTKGHSLSLHDFLLGPCNIPSLVLEGNSVPSHLHPRVSAAVLLRHRVVSLNPAHAIVIRSFMKLSSVAQLLSVTHALTCINRCLEKPWKNMHLTIREGCL